MFRYRASAKSWYDALTAIVSHATLIDVLSSLRWVTPDYFTPDLRWLQNLGPEQIEDWVVFFPQHVGSGELRRRILGHEPLSLYRRDRRRDPFFGGIRDPKHLHAANRIAGLPTAFDDTGAEALARPRRGAFLVYPVTENDLPADKPHHEIVPEKVVMAFDLVAPGDAHAADGRLVTFTTRDSSHQAEAIIDVPGM